MSFSEIYKIILIVIFVSILISLATSVFFLVKDKSGSNRTAKSLTVRAALSGILFLMLIYGFFAGLLKPHGLMLPAKTPQQAVIENDSQSENSKVQ